MTTNGHHVDGSKALSAYINDPKKSAQCACYQQATTKTINRQTSPSANLAHSARELPKSYIENRTSYIGAARRHRRFLTTPARCLTFPPPHLLRQPRALRAGTSQIVHRTSYIVHRQTHFQCVCLAVALFLIETKVLAKFVQCTHYQ